MDTISFFINTETPDVGAPESREPALPERPRISPCITFFVMVIVSLVSAVVVAEAPLIVVGLY